MIFGASGFDLIDDGLGFDTLNGGNDTLIGGNGNDKMNGGLGNDEFIFANGFGNDTIIRFAAKSNLEDINLSARSCTSWTW